MWQFAGKFPGSLWSDWLDTTVLCSCVTASNQYTTCFSCDNGRDVPFLKEI